MKKASGTQRLRARLLWWTIQSKILKFLMIRHVAAARILLWDLEDHRTEMMSCPRLIRRTALVMAAVRAFESSGGMETNEPLHAERSADDELKGLGRDWN